MLEVQASLRMAQATFDKYFEKGEELLRYKEKHYSKTLAGKFLPF